MEALKLKTVDDLFAAMQEDERVELINGEIVKRPMARFSHGLVQSGLADEVAFFKRKKGPDGWWIATEVSVRYSEHHCPVHDLAGWRKSSVPEPPTGVMDIRPDWVCEITSPGHESKDLVVQLLQLETWQVPHYWIISPEDHMIIVYEYEAAQGHYRVVFSREYSAETDSGLVAIPPFAERGIDLGYIFGIEVE